MQNQQQQQGSQDNSLDFLWIVGCIIAAIIIIWYFFQAQIISVIFQVRFYEISIIDYVFSLWSKIIQILGFQPQAPDLQEWALFIERNKNGVGVDFSNVAKVSRAIGDYLKYPLMLFSVIAAWLIYSSGATKNFRHIFSAVSLKKYEEDTWPYIKPVVSLDLVNQKLDDGFWAMALSPMNFCKKNNLLDVELRGGKYSATLKKGAAYRVLSLQLGPRWISPDKLPIYLKALFAIFAARINGDKKNADNMLEQISGSATSGGKINFSGVEKMMYKNMHSKKVLTTTYLHGYVTTVLASMLLGSRTLGVLASSEFIWLKPIDRRMWYMLNSVGRTTAVSEISGAFAHWLAEKKLGLPIMSPMVDEAVRGLEIAISEIIYKPDNEDN